MNICGICSCSSLKQHDKLKNYYKCSNCNTWNKLPRHEQNDLISGGYKYPDANDTFNSFSKFKPLILKFEKLVPVKTIYDVATGIGGLPYLAKLRKWDVYGGNELRIENVHCARMLYGINLDLDYFEDVKMEMKFGVVVCHHGLEHMNNPITVLDKMIDRTVKGGIIYLEHPCIPNDDYLERYADGSESLGAHSYEWTFESFKYFITCVRNMKQTKIIESKCGWETVNNLHAYIPPVQYWLLRKE